MDVYVVLSFGNWRDPRQVVVTLGGAEVGVLDPPLAVALLRLQLRALHSKVAFVVEAAVGQVLHPVHGLDRVEPALPPPLGQVLAHPGRLQLLQGVQVGARQPVVLQALGR